MNIFRRTRSLSRGRGGKFSQGQARPPSPTPSLPPVPPTQAIPVPVEVTHDYINVVPLPPSNPGSSHHNPRDTGARSKEGQSGDFSNKRGRKEHPFDWDVDSSVRTRSSSPDVGSGGVGEEDFYISYVKSTPMGVVLIDLFMETLEIKKKLGIHQSRGSLKIYCRQIYFADMAKKDMEKTKEAGMIAQTSDKVEKLLLNRELNAHALKPEIETPKFFSPSPTLHTISDRAEVNKIFPIRNKFSGNSKESVLEFLETINLAQDICKLSKSEFLEYLKLCTTGRPNELIVNLLKAGEGLSSIYHNLVAQYDNRPSVSESKKQLNTYRAHKNETFSEVSSKIVQWAGRVSSELPSEEARNSLFNIETYQGLLNALPALSRTYIIDTNSNLTAKLGRQVTGGELIRGLHLYVTSINEDIQAHGAQPPSKNKFIDNSKTLGKFQKGNYKGGKNYPQQQSLAQGGTNFPKANKVYNLEAKASETKVSNSNPRNQGKVGQNTGFNKGSSPQIANNSKSNKNPSYPSTKYCSLCGFKNHTASDVCRYMRDNNGNVVKIHPVKETCTGCPAHVSPRLHHPPSLCPYRADSTVKHIFCR